MTGRSKLLVSKGLRLPIRLLTLYINALFNLLRLRYCQKDSDVKTQAESQIDQPVKRVNTSQDFVYYSAGKESHKVDKISPTKIGKRPIYKFFFDHHNQ